MRIIFYVLLLFSYLCSSGQYQYLLKGTAPNDFNNRKLFLVIEDNYSKQKYKLTDSAVVKSGQFVFKGEIKKVSEKATLYTMDKEIKGFVYFIVDSGINTMLIKPLPSKWPLYKNKLSNSILLNSQSNVIKKTLDSLTNNYYLTKGRPSDKNRYVIELDTSTKKQLQRKQIDILKQNPDIFYSMIYLYSELKTLGGFKIAEADELYRALDYQLQSSKLGIEIKEIIDAARSTEIGHPVSVFTIRSNDNNYFSNKSLTGTVYLLAFGATWCKPCKEQIPKLKQIYEKYNAEGFRIVYVNLDDKTQLWKQHIEKYKLNNWINVSEGVTWENSEMIKHFNISAIPFYLLVNKDGKIVYNPDQLNDFNYKQLEKTIQMSLK